MKCILILIFSILVLLVNAQKAESCLKESVLTIGIYDKAECGEVTDKIRVLPKDGDIIEAVMDKTGISEIGTGFIFEYNSSTYVITCEHVLYKAGRIVGFDSEYNHEYELELVGSDMLYDIVVLQFKHREDAKMFKGLTINDNDRISKNTTLKHIGFWTVESELNYKEGHFIPSSNKDNHSIHLTGKGYFETDGYLPGGFSGGPVLNDNGQVVGMNTARNRKGTSYSLDSKILKRLVKDIIEDGKVTRAFTGIEFAQDNLTSQIYINDIIKNTPASKRYKDLIGKKVDKINGHSVSNIYKALQILDEVQHTDVIRIGLKNGNEISIKSGSLGDKNLVKIATHAISQYAYSNLKRLELTDNLVFVREEGQKFIIRTAGIEGDKVYCLSNLAQLGIIIRMFAPLGYFELGKDDSHVFIKEIKFSQNGNKRLLYY